LQQHTNIERNPVWIDRETMNRNITGASGNFEIVHRKNKEW
jgi:hypothetical protein